MRPQSLTFEILWDAVPGGYWSLRIMAKEYGSREVVCIPVSPNELEDESVFDRVFREAKRRLLDRIRGQQY